MPCALCSPVLNADPECVSSENAHQVLISEQEKTSTGPKRNTPASDSRRLIGAGIADLRTLAGTTFRRMTTCRLSRILYQLAYFIAVVLALNLMLVHGHNLALPLNVLKPDDHIHVQETQDCLFGKDSVNRNERHHLSFRL